MAQCRRLESLFADMSTDVRRQLAVSIQMKACVSHLIASEVLL